MSLRRLIKVHKRQLSRTMRYSAAFKKRALPEFETRSYSSANKGATVKSPQAVHRAAPGKPREENMPIALVSRKRSYEDESDTYKRVTFGTENSGMLDSFVRRGEDLEREHHQKQLEFAEESACLVPTVLGNPTQVLARRKFFRGVVLTLLAPAALLTVVVAKTLLVVGTSATPATEIPAKRVVASQPPNAKELVKNEGSSQLTPGVTLPPLEGAVPQEDGEVLQRRARRSLEVGDNTTALRFSREAVSSDPQNAAPYLYLGEAFEGLGMKDKAIGAYSDCMRNATLGPIDQCRALARSEN